jgi:uroporphyrinogen decarboxylase
MAEMTAIERVSAVLAGERPDRPPVNFWHHFSPTAASGQAAVDAHLQHLRRFDLDFLKVMNDNPYPTRRAVRTAADLRDLPVLHSDEDGYCKQLALLRALSAELTGKVLMVTTVFNSWAVLRRIVTPPVDDRHHPPILHGPPTPMDVRLSALLAEDRSAVGMALDAIAMSQANFARRCLEAGADGIFLSVRDDWVDMPGNGLSTYDEMVRLGDGQILTASRGARFNILHVCGVPRDFESFAAYPVQAISWADRAAGPAIREVIERIKPVVCGGVDNLATLPNGTPASVAAEVRDAIAQAGDRPIIVAPGCTYDPDVVPPRNLDAMVQAVRAAGSPA